MIFTLFRYWARAGGGGLQEIGAQPANALFTLDNSKIEVTSQTLLDPIPAGLYRSEKQHIPPIWGPFGAIHITYLKGFCGLFNPLYNHCFVK